MQISSFTPLGSALLAGLIWFLAAPGFAETKTKPIKKTIPETAPTAFVRLWKGDFTTKRIVRVTLRPLARKTAVSDIVNAAEHYYFGEYNSVPTGSSVIEVFALDDPKNKLAALSITLQPGSFSTVLLQETNGEIAVELLDDMVSSKSTAELIVRNFVPTLSVLEVDAGSDVHVKLHSPDSFLRIRGLPRIKFEVRTVGTQSNGKAQQWSNEIDYSRNARATLLIFPDTYGRIRPRVVADGELSATAASK